MTLVQTRMTHVWPQPKKAEYLSRLLYPQISCLNNEAGCTQSDFKEALSA